MSDDDFPQPDRLEGAPHPRETAHLIGQDAARDAFLAAYSSDRLHHGWLISGPKGVGKATLAPFDGDGASLTIDIRNEYLVARIGDHILESVPDLITVLDYETGTPINAERLRFGQRVTVVGVGCPDYYRTTRALEVVAPRCFGFDFDYVPIEQRV